MEGRQILDAVPITNEAVDPRMEKTNGGFNGSNSASSFLISYILLETKI